MLANEKMTLLHFIYHLCDKSSETLVKGGKTFLNVEVFLESHDTNIS